MVKSLCGILSIVGLALWLTHSPALARRPTGGPGGGHATNGQCGTADNVADGTAPTAGLCSSGTASTVNGGGAWSWTCAGSNGGGSALCSAPLAATPVNGICGAATGSCTAGAPGNLTNLSGPVAWTCQGNNGGGTASCMTTTAGVTLPSGWGLVRSDRFGTGASSTVTNYAQLHALYNEGQFYNVDANGLVRIPNVVINGEQETYEHFENSIVFSPDHLTIEGRGQPDGSIASGEMVSKSSSRNFCAEARYVIPNADKSWPSFWFYAATSGSDTSEIDIEQPITPYQGVHAVTMYNKPLQAPPTIADSRFTSQYMTWTDPGFDASAAPHYYTTCYNDAGAGLISRYIDGELIYTAVWKWDLSLGGTGHGPDAAAIMNLAVGGAWPGNLANPAAYVGDLQVYSIEYYGP
jgi:hypothetical protein